MFVHARGMMASYATRSQYPFTITQGPLPSTPHPVVLSVLWLGWRVSFHYMLSIPLHGFFMSQWCFYVFLYVLVINDIW